MEGYFPSLKAGANETALEEERRLMYVAATRAKDHLVLCYPSQESPRVWQFSEGPFKGGLSAFIQNLPTGVVKYCSPGFIKKSPGSQWSAPKFRSVRLGSVHPSGLRTGDRVQHPAFGQGVISKFPDDDKVEVLFRDVGRKMLHLGYTTLEKI